MYISNSGNIGMATLLQNNKNCIKTLTNGNNIVNVNAGGNIIVGNVVSAGTPSLVPTNMVNSGVATPNLLNGVNPAAAVTNVSNALVLPTHSQTILITNNAAGTSNILTYQQYQQLLQQQPQHPHQHTHPSQQPQQQTQRILITPNTVSVPVGSLLSNGSPDGLAVLANSGSATCTAASGVSTTTSTSGINQGTYLVTTSNINTINGFQQQFQQQIASNVQIVQQQHRQQKLVTNNRSATLIFNRNYHSFGNSTQRMTHGTILNKTPATVMKTQNQQQQPIVVNNVALQQVINGSSEGHLINVVKPLRKAAVARSSITAVASTNAAHLTQSQSKSLQQSHQQSRYSSPAIKQIKRQRAIVINSKGPATVATLSKSAAGQATTLAKSNSIAPAVSITVSIAAGPISNSTQTVSVVVDNNHTSTRNKVLLKSPTTNELSNQIIQAVSIDATNINNNSATIANNGSYESKNISENDNIYNIKSSNNYMHTASSSYVASTTTNKKTVAVVSPSVWSWSKSTATIPSSNTLISTPSVIITSNDNATTTTAAASVSQPLTVSSISSRNPNLTTNANKQNLKNQILTNCSSSDTNISYTGSTIKSLISPSCKSLSNLDSTAIPCESSSTYLVNNSSAIDEIKALPAAIETADTILNEQSSEPEIDIVINNVVCSFSVRCHLNLREIALHGANVEYRRENGMVTMKLRRPYTTASIWSSGRITCTGATSEDQARIAARRYARCLQKLGFVVRFHNFRVVNVLGTCSMPWAIKIVNFSEKFKREASYEPELHPGVTYKLRNPKATLKIFSTGSITVTAASVANVQAAIEHIYPLVYEFRKKRSVEELEQLRQKQHHIATLHDSTNIDGSEDAMLSCAKKTMRQNSISNQPTVPPLKKLCNYLTDTTANTANFELDCDDTPSNLSIDEDIVMYDPIDIIEGPYDADVNDDADNNEIL